MSWDNPIAVISPVQMWQAATAGPQRYLLIGDGDHRDLGIKQAVTAAFGTLALAKITGLAVESEVALMEPVIQAFNKASWFDRLRGLDVQQLTDRVRQYRTNWDVTDEQAHQRHEVVIESLVQARQHGIITYPLNRLSDQDKFDLLPEVTEDTRTRLRDVEAYQQQHGKWPPAHQGNRLLLELDRNWLRTAEARYMKQHMQQDFDRAMRLQTLARQHPRVGIFFGAAHFKLSSRRGIDAHLPAREHLQVLVSNGVSNDLLRQDNCTPPDFILRVDKGEGWVMPAAVAKGLWSRGPS